MRMPLELEWGDAKAKRNVAKAHAGKGMTMKKASNRQKPEMLDEYDFSRGVKGKYAKRYAAGTNVVFLDPDVAEVFHDSQTVNDVLRTLARLVKKLHEPPR